MRSSILLLLFGSDFTPAVGQLYPDLLGTLHDLGSFLGTHIMGDLTTEASVIH